MFGQVRSLLASHVYKPHVLGVRVEVFRTPSRGGNPGCVENIADPPMIDGLSIASLPDLLASKMDVILYRPQLRDYIDLAAIDASSPYKLEDGLRFHFHRYGITPTHTDAARMVELLKKPGALRSDDVLEHRREEVLAYLADRTRDVERYLHRLRVEIAPASFPPPQSPPMKLGPTKRFDEMIRSAHDSLPSGTSVGQSKC